MLARRGLPRAEPLMGWGRGLTSVRGQSTLKTTFLVWRERVGLGASLPSWRHVGIFPQTFVCVNSLALLRRCPGRERQRIVFRDLVFSDLPYQEAGGEELDNPLEISFCFLLGNKVGLG